MSVITRADYRISIRVVIYKTYYSSLRSLLSDLQPDRGMTHRGILDTFLDNRICIKGFQVVRIFVIHRICDATILYEFGCLKCGRVTFGNLSFLLFWNNAHTLGNCKRLFCPFISFP